MTNAELVASEYWRMFKKRGPVNFSTPKSQACRLNRTILPYLKREEVEALLAAYPDKGAWATACATIEARLLEPV